MTSFRFNFSGENEFKTDAEPQAEIQWLESVEVIPEKQIKELDSIVTHAQMVTCDDIEIGHVVVSEAISNIEDTGFKTAVKLAENEQSDLVTGKYEGGLKIWECTIDLLEYLVQNEEIQFENKNVLDLGCGAGILGIYAFMKSARLTFQDYNKEVLEYVTIPNVLLNIEEDTRESDIKKCKFYSGDWASFNKKIDNVFDVIVTSETIYNECNYDKLISLFEDRLSNKGVIFVAAKTHYFGVGGGTRQFEKAVEKNGLFSSEVCWKSTGGIQREILKITRIS
ncbi:Histidine protein methyltransferase 1-like protein [Operophtera brumata]|uniref:protein-histidine N-methyltransferase n=1 Tax=Operophtera brumata TaxID=104452 RepID=A0A0L7LJF0_OPEBR|nr:Histidine protein methyltransferase 1-like protein [Operophtera brumata]